MESRFGQVTQAGVISAMKTKHDPKTGRPAVVTSFYGRLDNVVVQKWLFEVLGEVGIFITAALGALIFSPSCVALAKRIVRFSFC